MKKVHYNLLLFLLFLLCYEPTFGQRRKIIYSPGYIADTGKVNALIKAANDSIFGGKLPAAMSIAKSAHALADKIKYRKGIGVTLNLKGRILYRTASFDSAILFSKKALVLALDLNDSVLQSSAYLNIGNSYFTKGNDIMAMEYYFKGLAVEEKLRVQSSNLYGFLNNIGGILINQKDYKKGLEYLLKSKSIAEETHNIKRLATIYHNLGSLYVKFENYNEARLCFEKSYQLAKEMNDIYTMNIHPSDMAEVYRLLKQYDTAYYYAQQNLTIVKKNGFKDQIAVTLMTLSNIQMKLGRFKEAEKVILEALALSKELKTEQVTKDIYQQMADLYVTIGNYEKAYDYFKLFSNTKDTILNKENSKLITEMNTKYTTEKKEKEIELLKKNEDIQKLELAKRKNELERQRTVSIGVFVGFLLLMVVAILTFSRYRLKKKANDQLQTAYHLIEEKNSAIEKSNRMITDSITYAKRIQDAILPSDEDISRLVSEDFFIFYKPSQIVSGDFYWCSSQQDKTIFVVADCTGHGVPGAFMSMIGNTLLNEIVNEQKITCTKEIASLLDKKIIHALHQDEGSEKYDGMDISICCIDKVERQISFTGAHHSMFIHDGLLRKLKGDPYAIGGAQQQNMKVFTSETINYTNPSYLYLLTDGYCDQSGGPENKRFSYRRFEELLTEMQPFTLAEQKEKLEHLFENWKGETKQRDDVLVIGIKC